jgi:transposase
MTLLRLLRAVHDPPTRTPTVLGVDDFALRRGHVYATVLIDIETGRPVDVLTDRTAETLTAWLQAHPGVEIICRDRAGAYAEGARLGAPEALQVADRWHVWNNLAAAVERTIAQHRGCLRHPDTPDRYHKPDSDDESATTPVDTPPARTDRIASHTRERHAVIHDLVGDGFGISAISAKLGLARGTVRRFARATTVDELLVNDGTGHRPSVLEEFKLHLTQQWNRGCTNAALLLKDIQTQGYQGSYQLLRDYLRPFRTAMAIPQPAPAPLKVRRVVGWIKMLKRQMCGRANLDLLRKRILLAD